MTDDYKTDKWLMNIFEGWFDPCPINPSFDGLKIEWQKKTFVNPPYSNPLPWVEKAIEENKKGNVVVLLLKLDTSTKWFAKLFEANARLLWFQNNEVDIAETYNEIIEIARREE
jgi:hypothetical protein